MDYAAKKAFEAKVKKVGKDLGLKSTKKDAPAAFGFGGSSSTSNPFSLDSPEERAGGGWGVFSDNNTAATEVDSARISAYAEMPANYPPLLRLFYVDRSILSNEAKRPVTLIFHVQLLVLVGLVFNLATAIVLTAAGRKRHWTLLLISAFSLLAVGLFQTGIFAQSFRGAYSGCSRSRAAALTLMVINGVVVAFYTFAGVCAFNGWARQATAKGQFEVLYRILAGIESLFWTVVLFYSTYSAFEYYTLRKKKVLGLAPAMERPPDVENPAAVPRGSHTPHALSNARAQEIRDKYLGTSGLQ